MCRLNVKYINISYEKCLIGFDYFMKNKIMEIPTLYVACLNFLFVLIILG